MAICISCREERRRLRISYAGLFQLKERQKPREPAVWAQMGSEPPRVFLWKVVA